MRIDHALFGSALAAAMIVAAAPASAVVYTYENTYNVGQDEFKLDKFSTPYTPIITATLSDTLLKGTFKDTFLFGIPQDGVGSGNLSTNFASDDVKLVIYDVLINGKSYGAPPASQTGSGQYLTVDGIPITNFFSNNQYNSIVVIGEVLGDRGTYSGNLTFVANAVPEPATWAMMVLGFGVIGGAVRQQRRTTKVAFS